MAPDNRKLEQGQSDTPPDKDNLDQDILAFEEIVIEEMAIDGICGVY
jgi:mycofactocin precursor